MATFNIRGKNIEVTPNLREYVEKRVGKITKYFDNMEEIAVLLSVEKDRQIVEVTAEVRGGLILRGQESNVDMYTSIDLVVEKLERAACGQRRSANLRFKSNTRTRANTPLSKPSILSLSPWTCRKLSCR